MTFFAKPNCRPGSRPGFQTVADTMNPEANEQAERFSDRQTYLAMLNVLEDFNADRAHTAQTNAAILNILDDFNGEKSRFGDTTRAVTNILEDFNGEKSRLGDTTRAVTNILEDLDLAGDRLRTLNADLERRVEERTLDLVRSEERLRLLVEGVKDYAIFLLDPAGHVMTWNVGAERIKGYAADEVIGRHFSIFYTPEDVTRGKPDKELEIARTSERYEEEGERVRKDGSRFWAVVTVTALYDPTGKHVGFAKITRDITERKRAAEQLNLMVESTPVGMLMVNQEGAITLVNRQVETLFGYTRDELMGQPVETLLPEKLRLQHSHDRRQFMTAPLARAMGAGRELFGMRKDQSLFPVEIGLAPIRNESGVFLLASVIDITERKAAEVRTREALRQEMLLKEIHHRVKNNLQVISSLLFLQSAFVTDPQTAEILKESQSRVKSIALIHEKLYRSKDMGKLDFAEYVRDLVTDISRTYPVGQERIAIHLETEDVFLGVDTAIPCGLIINELVSNALKHAFPDKNRGDVWIDIHARPDGQYVLQVRDNGGGIPKEHDWKRSKSLGLRLVVDLTKQLDGNLEVANDPGASFRINFAEMQYKERS